MMRASFVLGNLPAGAFNLGAIMVSSDISSVRAKAKELRKQRFDVEIFDDKMISDEAWNNFKKLADANNGRIPDTLLPETKMYQENAAWAQKLADKDYTVLDIGNPTSRGPSVFYSMEQSTIFGNLPTK